MLRKELLAIRWRLLPAALLVLLVTYNFARDFGMGDASITGSAPWGVRNHASDVWWAWTAQITPLFTLIAVLLGAGLVAGEAGQGTIRFLLARPISRSRVLLTKYGITAGALLGLIILGSVLLLIYSSSQGYGFSLTDLVASTLLLWLFSLFALGVALCVSALSRSALLTVLVALGTVILVLQPFNWPVLLTLPSDHDTITPETLARDALICAAPAALGLLAALWVFRRRAY
jgi:ABC-2 type transport system permease protein